jgi:hypothetical protein
MKRRKRSEKTFKLFSNKGQFFRTEDGALCKIYVDYKFVKTFSLPLPISPRFPIDKKTVLA